MIPALSTVITYTADGSTTAFSFTRRVDVASDIVVYTQTGTDAPVKQTTGFSTVVATDGESATVTFSTAPASGVVVYLMRATDQTQPIAISNTEFVPPSTVEKQLDRQVMMIQEMQEQVGRAFVAQPGASGKTFAPLEEGHFYKADANGNLIDGGLGVLVPLGGTTGQVPVKSSATDGAIEWKSAVPGGGDMLASAYDPAGIGSNAFDGAPVKTKEGIAALKTSVFSAAELVSGSQTGEYILTDNSDGDYDDDITDDANGGFVIASDTPPYVWTRRPDWYLDGEHFKLGATSDDTDAVQGLFNISARRKRVAMLPDGEITIQSVTVPSGADICGRGRQSVLKAHASLGLTSVMLMNPSQSSYDDKNIRLRDLAIDGNALWREGDTQTRFAPLCSFVRAENVILDNIEGRNFGYNLISLGSSKRCTVRDSEFHDVGFKGDTTNGGVCLWIGQITTDMAENIVIERGYFHDNEWTTIQLNGQNNSLLFSRFEDNKEAHVFSSYDGTSSYIVSRGILVMGNSFLRAGLKTISGHGCEFGWQEGGRFLYNYIDDTKHFGVAFSQPRNVIIHGNHIKNFNRVTSDEFGYGSDHAGIGILPQKTNSEDLCAGVRVTQNVIRDDLETPLGSYAVMVAGAGSNATDLAITDNDFNNPSGWAGGAALRLDKADPATSRIEKNVGAPDVYGWTVKSNLPYRASFWYKPADILPKVTSTVAQTADRMYAFRLFIRDTCTISDLAVRVLTGVASSHAKMAIYRDDGTTATLLGSTDSNPADTGSTGYKECVLDETVTLVPGEYLGVILVDGATTLATIDTASNVAEWGSSASSGAFGVGGVGVYYSRTYTDGFPATFTKATGSTTIQDASCPFFTFKVSAV